MMKKTLKKIIKYHTDWTGRVVYGDCVGDIYKFYSNTINIIFKKNENIEVTIIGIDLKTKDNIFYKKSVNKTGFIFYFNTKAEQNVKFSIEIKNLKNNKFRLYESFVINNEFPTRLPYNKIAHAMGNIDGILYTNSKEAFLKSYKRGYRMFEVDLQLSLDMEPVLFHDLKDYSGTRWLKSGVNTITSHNLKFFKYAEKFSVLTLKELIEIAEKYEDCYFILDIKQNIPRPLLQRLIDFYKNNVPYKKNNFINTLQFFLKGRQNDSVESIVCSKVLQYTKGDLDIVNRLIPQVHIHNIADIYNSYNFPMKIWRDNYDTAENDVINMRVHGVFDYSRNYKKMAMDEWKREDIKYYFYNVESIKNKSCFGCFCD